MSRMILPEALFWWRLQELLSTLLEHLVKRAKNNWFTELQPNTKDEQYLPWKQLKLNKIESCVLKYLRRHYTFQLVIYSMGKQQFSVNIESSRKVSSKWSYYFDDVFE